MTKEDVKDDMKKIDDGGPAFPLLMPDAGGGR